MSILDYIQNCLDNNEFTVGVIVDLQKAFDMVNYNILISKFKHYDILGITKDSLKSYLKIRKQYISLGNNKSPIKTILSYSLSFFLLILATPKHV